MTNRQSTNAGDRRRMLIVTPTFNPGSFLNQTIVSVVTQSAPALVVHLHVQDGGSTDQTAGTLQRWTDRLASGAVETDFAQFTFTYETRADRGMYDALRLGFEHLRPTDGDILTWINGDDLLAPGCLGTVAAVFTDIDGCEFLSGRIALLNEAGAIVVIGHPLPYNQSNLANGLHDGRSFRFIMQEGTFFSGRIWNAVGGIDPSFRLAGDWDLWRRLAAQADHVLVDTITGFHRRREGQLSSDMDGYYREIDGVVAALPGAALANNQIGTIASFNHETGRWVATRYDTVTLSRQKFFRDGAPVENASCQPLSGFLPPEGPYPEHRLPLGIRWLNRRRATIMLRAPSFGRYRVRLTVRASRDGIILALSVDGREPVSVALGAPDNLVDEVVETVWWLNAGENRLDLDLGGELPAYSLLFITCEAVKTVERIDVLSLATPPGASMIEPTDLAIAIFCLDDEAEAFERSLASCRALVQAGAWLGVSISGEHKAVTAAADGWRDIISARLDPHDPPCSAAIGPIGGSQRSRLLLRRGLLAHPRGVGAAQTLVRTGGAASVTGLVNVRDAAGRSLELTDASSDLPTLLGPGIDRAATGGSEADALADALPLAYRLAGPGAVKTLGSVWLVDDDQPVMGVTPVLLIAQALALAGYDARYLVWHPGISLAAADGPVIVSQDCRTLAGATASVALLRGHGIGISWSDEPAIRLPFCLAVDGYLPLARATARKAFGFDADETILIVGEPDGGDTSRILDLIAEREPPGCLVLNAGAQTGRACGAVRLLEFGSCTRPRLLSWLMAAADAAICLDPRSSAVALAAWLCGVEVRGPSGGAVLPDGADDPAAAGNGRSEAEADRRRIDRDRAIAVSTGTLALLARRLASSRPLAHPDASSLRGGTVGLRCYDRPPTDGYPSRFPPSGAIFPLRGTVAWRSRDVAQGLLIGDGQADLIICPDYPATQLDLYVRATPGDVWAVDIPGQTLQVMIQTDGDQRIGLPGQWDARPNLVSMRWLRGPDGFHPLLIVGSEIIGPDRPTEPDWRDFAIRAMTARENEAPELDVEGDWQPVSGFRQPDPPAPGLGLLVPFRWMLGARAEIRLRVQRAGPRSLRIGFTSPVAGASIRPVLRGEEADWSAPSLGILGHVEYRQWSIDLPEGEAFVALEVSDPDRYGAAGLSVIITSVDLA